MEDNTSKCIFMRASFFFLILVKFVLIFRKTNDFCRTESLSSVSPNQLGKKVPLLNSKCSVNSVTAVFGEQIPVFMLSCL